MWPAVHDLSQAGTGSYACGFVRACVRGCTLALEKHAPVEDVRPAAFGDEVSHVVLSPVIQLTDCKAESDSFHVKVWSMSLRHCEFSMLFLVSYSSDKERERVLLHVGPSLVSARNSSCSKILTSSPCLV